MSFTKSDLREYYETIRSAREHRLEAEAKVVLARLQAEEVDAMYARFLADKRTALQSIQTQDDTKGALREQALLTQAEVAALASDPRLSLSSGHVWPGRKRRLSSEAGTNGVNPERPSVNVEGNRIRKLGKIPHE
jgi:hypothetical protein